LDAGDLPDEALPDEALPDEALPDEALRGTEVAELRGGRAGSLAEGRRPAAA